MTMTLGIQRPDTKAEVILGVDTHLDFHTAVAVDHLGRRLGELSVPTTAKGYERLLCWAEGLGSVRCAGIEGTSSYGVGLARYLRPPGFQWWKSRDLSVAISGATVNPTPSARRQQPGQCWPARRSESLRAATDEWR